MQQTPPPVPYLTQQLADDAVAKLPEAFTRGGRLMKPVLRKGSELSSRKAKALSGAAGLDPQHPPLLVCDQVAMFVDRVLFDAPWSKSRDLVLTWHQIAYYGIEVFVGTWLICGDARFQLSNSVEADADVNKSLDALAAVGRALLGKRGFRMKRHALARQFANTLHWNQLPSGPPPEGETATSKGTIAQMQAVLQRYADEQFMDEFDHGWPETPGEVALSKLDVLRITDRGVWAKKIIEPAWKPKDGRIQYLKGWVCEPWSRIVERGIRTEDEQEIMEIGGMRVDVEGWIGTRNLRHYAQILKSLAQAWSGEWAPGRVSFEVLVPGLQEAEAVGAKIEAPPTADRVSEMRKHLSLPDDEVIHAILNGIVLGSTGAFHRLLHSRNARTRACYSVAWSDIAGSPVRLSRGAADRRSDEVNGSDFGSDDDGTHTEVFLDFGDYQRLICSADPLSDVFAFRRILADITESQDVPSPPDG